MDCMWQVREPRPLPSSRLDKVLIACLLGLRAKTKAGLEDPAARWPTPWGVTSAPVGTLLVSVQLSPVHMRRLNPDKHMLFPTIIQDSRMNFSIAETQTHGPSFSLV